MDLKKVLDLNSFYQQFEVYKKPQSVSVLLNTIPTILASLAPPLWMVQNKLWIFLGISLFFNGFICCFSLGYSSSDGF